MLQTRMKTMRALACAAAFPLTVPATVQAQESAEQIVARWIADGDALDGFSVKRGGIEHDASTRVTTVRDLTFVFEIPEVKNTDAAGRETGLSTSQKVTFPALRFEELGFEGGYYQAAAISADSALLDFSVSDASGTASRTSGTYKAMRIEHPRWAALPDIPEAPQSPVSRYYPLVAALVDFSFDGMRIDGIEVKSSGDNPKLDMDIVYGPMTAGKTVRGDISEMKADGLTMTIRSEIPDENGVPKSENFEFTTGPFVASQYSYGAVVRAFDPSAPTGAADAAYTPVIGRIEVPSVKIKSEEFNGEIGKIAMTDVGVRRPTVPVLKRADEMFLATQGGAEPPEKEMLEFIFGAYGAFRLGSMAVSDLSMTGAQGISFKLGSYEIRDLSSKGLGGYELKAFEGTGPEGVAVRLGRIAVKDIGFPDLKALMNVEAAEQAGDVKAMMAAIPTLGEMSYEDIAVKVPGEVEMSLGRAAIAMGGHIGPIPTRLAFAMENLAFPVAQLKPEDRKPFEDLGYDRVDASANISYAWEETTQKANVTGSAELVDGGHLEVKAELGGLPKFVFEDPQNGPAAAMIAMNFIQGSAKFTDASIVERGLKVAAKEQGTDPATMKAQALGMLPFLLAELKRPEFMTMVTDAANAFFNGKKTLSVTAIPPAPVPLLQLVGTAQADPGAVVDTLKVRVTAE